MPFENLLDPTVLAAPAFVICVAWEWWAVRTQRANGTYQTSDAIVSMAMGLGSVIAPALAGFVLFNVSLIVWEYRFYTLPITWWSLLAAFIVYDFAYYWKHRFMHRMRWLWANHVVHHSSNFYNLSTALRQPWTGPINGLFIVSLPMVLAGWHPAVIGVVGGINLIYQFWIHTEAIDKMPKWFEAVWNTPSHHRVHHGRNARYLDANYAGVWIIWDKMFGTFVPELASDKPDYGLVAPLESRNPFWVAIHEYVALAKDMYQDGLRPDKWIRRLYNPPGWSPDGNHNGSREAKMAYLARHPEDAGQPGLQMGSQPRQPSDAIA